MQAEKQRKLNIGCAMLFATVFGVMFLFSLWTPLIADDYNYAFGYSTSTRISSLREILVSMAWHRKLLNPRVFSHGWLSLVLMYPRWVFAALNGAAAVLFSWTTESFLREKGSRKPVLMTAVVWMLLWICMPEAKTVSQRDELHGEKGTVDAISARVMSSVQEMGETAERVVHSDFWPGIWRVFEVCLGIIMLIAGVAGVVTLGFLLFDGSFFSNSFFLNRVIEVVAENAYTVLDLLSYPPFVIALAGAVVLPFIGMIYGGVMLIFDLKAPKWHPGLCLFVIWLIAITVLAVMGAMLLFKGGW
jgi:hypothetical protein